MKRDRQVLAYPIDSCIVGGGDEIDGSKESTVG